MPELDCIADIAMQEDLVPGLRVTNPGSRDRDIENGALATLQGAPYDQSLSGASSACQYGVGTRF